MLVLVRAMIYATLFISAFLVYVPAGILAGAGLATRPPIGVVQAAGAVVTAAGSLLIVWCVLTFAFVGEGTPAPFDPPRQLVVRGPYRLVRNPMYIGAGLALGGAALAYESGRLAAYAALLLGILHVFVRLYEEPVLRRTFGAEYDAYCTRVARWWPRW
jgi:protein-S-isoprenylcysteine O-methyltransferase Ste14